MYPTPIHKKSLLMQIAYSGSVLLTLLIWLIPVFVVVITSGKSLEELHLGNFFGLSTEWQFIENYTYLFVTTKIEQFLFNSVLIVIPTIIGILLVSSLAAFSLAKYSFRMNVPIFALFIAGNFIPYQILMIPVRHLTIHLGMYDTIMGLALFHIAFQCGFSTMFLRNFIQKIPDSLVEMARIDGASELRIFYSIIVPLIRPALAAIIVLMFVFVWNDYFWALVLSQSDSVRPVTLGLAELRGGMTLLWHFMSAGAIIAALPPVLMFFLMQKHFIAGLTLGAIKN